MPIPKSNRDSPSEPSRKSRTLPLPRPALTALNAARTCPPSQLYSHFNVLFPHLSDPDMLSYVTKRLHNGLTTPVARINYAILLCAITRHTKQTTTLLTAPYPPYTTPREEALARLSLIAALVRAGVKQPSMIPILRQIACAESGRWRMGDASVAIVTHLIPIADHSLLREWCRDRRFYGDGLNLACVLLKQGVLSDKAFTKIYHTTDHVRKPLMEASDTGFSMLTKHALNIPPVWLQVLSTKHELLGLSVWPVLQIPSAGVEKKLLLITLLPTAARYVSPENFDKVFTSYVGKISKTLCDMRDRAGVRIRLERVTESAKRVVKNTFDRIGAEIWKQLSKVTREIDEADHLCTRFILWSVRHGIVHRLFPKLDILSDMEERLSKKLFEAIVREFAKTSEPGVRASLVRFLLVFAVKCAFVEDTVKILALYTGFDGGEGANFKLERYKSVDDDTFAGCLPVPTSPLSQTDAGVAFRRLVEFCTDQRMISSYLNVLRKGLESGMTPRCTPRIEADRNLKEVIFRIVDSVSRPMEPLGKPLRDSVQILAEFVAIQYFAPVEDPEEVQQSMNEFLRLTESLQTCISAVLETGGQVNRKEPTSVEKVAHLITELCGHESASFRQISVKAVEVLGSRLDDAVTAVLFDALESFVSGNGVAGNNDVTYHDEDGADEDGDGEESEGREEDDEEDTEGGDKAMEGDKEEEEEEESESDSGDEERRGEQALNANAKQGEDGCADTSEPEMENTDSDRQRDLRDQSEDEDDSGPDVDMDPDDEDPEVLARFDKRLSMHIKLIKKEKKTAKQRKVKTLFRFTQVSRILSLIESVAKILRMRIETARDVDQRDHIVFLDLHARLYEFALGSEAENGRFLTQVTTLAAKQMMLPCSLFVGKIADTETVVEIAHRFLHSIRDCSFEKKPSDEETRILSKSAGCLVGTAAALTNNDYGQFLPIYEELLRLLLQSTKHVVNPGMLASYFRKAPGEASKLLAIVEELLEEDGITKNLRTNASEIIMELAEAARHGSDFSVENLDTFWKRLYQFLEKTVASENVKRWRPLAIANFVQAASHGIKANRFNDGEKLSTALSETVKNSHINRQERSKLLKLLRTSGHGHSAKRKRQTNGEEKQSSEESKDGLETSKRLTKRVKQTNL